jgi:hypothetical protein
MTAIREMVLTPWADAMLQRRCRRLLTQFVHEYWSAFEDLLRAQRERDLNVWFQFDALREAHRHFHEAYEDGDALRVLRRLWGTATNRRATGSLAPLTAADIDLAVTQFARICETLTAASASVGGPTVGHPALATPRGDVRSSSRGEENCAAMCRS